MIEQFSPRPVTAAPSSEAARPINGLADAVKLIFIGWVIVGAAGAIAGMSQRSIIKRAVAGQSVTMAEATAADNRVAAIAVFGLVLLVITAIVFIWWFRRAYGNLDTLGL